MLMVTSGLSGGELSNLRRILEGSHHHSIGDPNEVPAIRQIGVMEVTAPRRGAERRNLLHAVGSTDHPRELAPARNKWAQRGWASYDLLG